jgi:hypothetical protein
MLRSRIVLFFAGLMLVAGAASAQTKISGTLQCAKADPENAIPVGDRPEHTLLISQQKCTWTKPIQLEGVDAKTGQDTVFSDAYGVKTRDTGYHVSTMADGDQFVVRFAGVTTTDKNGVMQTQSGTWSFLSGTGKLKGLKGKGTYTAKGAADGTATADIEGDYQITGK